MTTEHHIYGPPGTGKTTTAAKNVARAIKTYGANEVLVASFTKAAAAEIASREMFADGFEVKMNPKMVGTLHALCYRALGFPKLADTVVKQFNAEHPVFALTGMQGDIDDPGAGGDVERLDGAASGDGLFQAYQLARARCQDRATWNLPLQGFAKAWEDFKVQTGTLDFTDLIEVAGRDLEEAPGSPRVGFFDEAQDFNALEFNAVRRWAVRMDRVVFLGDDDQSIYTFSGADPKNLTGRVLPPENIIVLGQSYRIPVLVYQLASRWIAQVTARRDKTFLPTETLGDVTHGLGATWRDPGRLVDMAANDAAHGKRVMILGTCSYHLVPTIERLRADGHVFHNPFRVTRGDWNPWNRRSGSASARAAAFLKADPSGLYPSWTWADLKLWSELIRVDGLLPRGFRKEVDRNCALNPTTSVDGHLLTQLREAIDLIKSEHPWSAHQAPLEWLKANAKPDKAKQLDYVTRAILRDRAIIQEGAEPMITLGTIHSVKGGEADVVYIIPDLSRRGWDQWSRRGEHRDAVIRTFYVGMTRAREAVRVLKPATGMAVNLGAMA